MLAYTFWHWPIPGATVYENKIALFQSALEAEPPAGYRGAFTLRHGAAPWLPGPAYLDWYTVDGFADLGTLNEAAVTASRKMPHDAVAALAGGGAGGVYAHRGGPSDLRGTGVAHWFGKPAGMKYDELFAKLAGAPGSLWMRQMVLGPSPEFVLFAPKDVVLPFHAQRLDVSVVWPR